VSLLVPAYNEEERLPDKLANLRAIDYPPDRLEVIFVSDGSTDRTNNILRAVEDPAIRSLVLTARSGKCNALNRAVAAARHDVLVFSDAATRFAPDAVRRLVRHFADARVGIVCGALQFEATPESRKTEGVYWGYESMLRLWKAARRHARQCAIYAVRRSCSLLPRTPDRRLGGAARRPPLGPSCTTRRRGPPLCASTSRASSRASPRGDRSSAAS
jgi:cellulose synthase/poly-beta-1,6-N-acetylglucosamine synthase-like glycosyltransferase